MKIFSIVLLVLSQSAWAGKTPYHYTAHPFFMNCKHSPSSDFDLVKKSPECKMEVERDDMGFRVVNCVLPNGGNATYVMANTKANCRKVAEMVARMKAAEGREQ
jgi:hypothetical protein